MLNNGSKAVLWFTGLSQSGKTTNSNAVQERLEALGIICATLDGDIVRKQFHGDLGFSASDRFENTRRAAQLAVEYSKSAQCILASFISPYREQRRIVRDMIESAGLLFVEIYCKCPLEQCEARDTKGLYAKARAGEIASFTGISDPYEEPESPDIVLLTESAQIEEHVDQIMEFLRLSRFLPARG